MTTTLSETGQNGTSPGHPALSRPAKRNAEAGQAGQTPRVVPSVPSADARNHLIYAARPRILARERSVTRQPIAGPSRWASVAGSTDPDLSLFQEILESESLR